MWKEGEEKRINFGVNYLFAPSIVAKLSVELRDFFEADKEDETRVLFQIAYGF